MFEKFKKITFDKVDRIIVLLVLLLHAAVILEFTFHKFEKLIPESLVAVIYIIIISVFWSFIILKKTSEEVAKIKVANQTLTDSLATHQDLIAELNKYRQYAQAYKSIAAAFSEIHHLHRFIKGENPASPDVANSVEIMIEHFGRFCDHIVDAYEDITGKKNISVCLKIIHGNEQKTSLTSNVKTLVRDLRNYAERDKDSEIIHPIKDNSAYITVLTNLKKTETERCFFENNLPLLRNYKNTSFPIYGQENYGETLTDEERSARWKMPYRSTIVSGILPSKTEYKKMNHLIGFICIDSVDCDGFNKEIDSKIFNGISDGLYNTMKEFKSFNKNITNHQKQKK